MYLTILVLCHPRMSVTHVGVTSMGARDSGQLVSDLGTHNIGSRLVPQRPFVDWGRCLAYVTLTTLKAALKPPLNRVKTPLKPEL